MIRIKNAVLRCPKHPKYKGKRYSTCGCWTCDDIFRVTQTIYRISKEYTFENPIVGEGRGRSRRRTPRHPIETVKFA